MMRSSDLENRLVAGDELTDRQRDVASLVQQYIAVAHEMPSAGWLSRRLNISRERARQHLEAIREKRRMPPLSK